MPPESLGQVIKSIPLQSSETPSETSPEPEAPACSNCGDFGWVRFNRPVGHPLFGKAQPCMACYPRRKTFENFRPVQGTEEALAAAREFAEGTGPPWLVLSGTWGAGKTHLCYAAKLRLYERLLTEVPVLSEVQYHYTPILLDAIKNGFDDGTWRDVEIRAMKAKVVILDDLGDVGRADAQRDMTAAGTTPWAREEVTKILSERYEDGLPTMVTTNHVRQEIDALYGPRLSSRLFGEATGQVKVVYMEAADYREGY